MSIILQRLAILYFLLTWQYSVAQSPCLTRLSHDQIVQQRHLELENKISQWIENQSSIEERAIITIPVVIHVVWHEDEENISDAQIQTQLEVLNNAFRAEDINLGIVPAGFQNLIVDAEIEFCLAQRTPTNQPTNGIERIRISNAAIVNDRAALFDVSPLWNPSDYLNIYVINLSPSVDGEATFPAEATAENDAIRMNYRSFGTIGTALQNPARNGGKSLVHEVGHYLNLNHIWGEQEGCTFDDLLTDTPLQTRSYLGQCPQNAQASCGTPDMFMNYMDYSDDACLAMFTPQQKARMLATLNTARSGLLNSRGCDTVVGINELDVLTDVDIFYNTESREIDIQFADNQKKVNLELYDLIGRQLAVNSIENEQIIKWQSCLSCKGIFILKIESNGKRLVKKLFF